MNKFLLISLTILSFLVLFGSIYQPAFSAETPSTYSGVAPDSTIRYAIKRAGEKIHGTFLHLFNNKALGNYEIGLLSERANELFYLADQEKISYIETATSRFITQTGLVKEQLEGNNVKPESVSNAISGLQVKFEQYRDHFPAQSAMWLFFQQAADSSAVLESNTQNI